MNKINYARFGLHLVAIGLAFSAAVCSAADDVDRTIAEATEQIKIDPRDVEAYKRRAAAFSSRDQHAEAIADLTAALDILPNDAKSLQERGFRYYRSGSIEKALTDLGEAIRLDPSNPLVFHRRSTVYWSTENYDAALADSNKAIELDQNYVDAYQNRGTIRSATKDLEGALADFNKAIELLPSARSYRGRGVYYLNEKHDSKLAMADFNKALELDPNDSSSYRARGKTRELASDFQGALADFSQAIDLSPNESELYLDRITLSQEMSKWSAVIADCTKLIELKNETAGVHFIRAGAYSKMNNYEKAEYDYDQVFKLARGVINVQALSEMAGNLHRLRTARRQPGNEATFEAKKQLKAQGLYSGSINGLQDSLAKSAIQSFQRSKDLAESGDLDEETGRRLGLTSTLIKPIDLSMSNVNGLFVLDGSSIVFGKPLGGPNGLPKVEFEGHVFKNQLTAISVIKVTDSVETRGRKASVQYTLRAVEGEFDADLQRNRIECVGNVAVKVEGEVVEQFQNGEIRKTKLSEIIFSDYRNILTSWLVAYDSSIGKTDMKSILPTLSRPLRLGTPGANLQTQPAPLLFKIEGFRLKPVQ